MSAIQDDSWLARIFGHPVYRVDPPVTGDEILRHGRTQASAFYYAKVDPEVSNQGDELMRAGGHLVSVQLTLDRDPGSPPPDPEGATVVVSRDRSEHREDILDLAEHGFTFSRFHQDPLIPAPVSRRIKREWADAFIQKDRGTGTYVAEVSDELAGFLCVLERRHGTSVVRSIDLIAVRPEWRRRGVARALVAHFIREESHGADRLEVGTQEENTISLHLYRSLGFVPRDRRQVFHVHVRNGAPLRSQPCASDP